MPSSLERHQVGAADDHLAAFDPPRRLDHPHHGERHRALARAGLADHAELLAGLEREADIVERLGAAEVGVVGDLEPLDPKDRLVPPHGQPIALPPGR